MSTLNPTILPEINQFIQEIDSSSISPERKETLTPLTHFIQAKVNEKRKISINFICTHNSRRSHLSQIWAQVMAQYFDIQNVTCYSGGTDATAVYPKVIETLQNTGFQTNALSTGENPVYSIKFAENEHPIIAFSKTFDDAFNPMANFCAVMTCSQADGGCPFIVGAEKRIPITYEDPKSFDHSPLQTEKYKERSLQIAAEMFYVFSQIQK